MIAHSFARNTSAVFLTFAFVLPLAACRPRHDSVAQTKEVTEFGRGQAEDLTVYTIPDAPTSKKIWDEMATPAYNMNPQLVYDSLVKPLVAGAPAAVRRTLDHTEAVAIYYYTANYYEYLNKSLRHTWDSDTLNRQQIKKWRNLILAVSSGLNKQAAAPCRVQRGTSLRPEVLDSIEVGGTFSDPGFMSTTAGEIPPQFRKGVTFKIKAHRCHSIAWMSRFPEEKEVLFAPGTSFKITRKTGTLARANVVIEMEEVESPGAADTDQPLPSRDSKGGSKGRPEGHAVAVGDLYGKTYLFQPTPIDFADNRFVKFKGNGVGDGFKEAIIALSTGEKPGRWKLAGDHMIYAEYQAGNRTMRLWFYIIDQNHLGRVTKASLIDSGVDEQALDDGDLSEEEIQGSELDIQQYYSVRP